MPSGRGTPPSSSSELKPLPQLQRDRNSRFPLAKDITCRHTQKTNLSWLVKNCLCQSKPVNLEEEPDYPNVRFQYKESRITQHKWTMIRPKETNKAPITDPQEMEIYELSDKQWTLSASACSEQFLSLLWFWRTACASPVIEFCSTPGFPLLHHHLAGCSPRVCKESDTTEQLNNNNCKRKPRSYYKKEHIKNLNCTETKSC